MKEEALKIIEEYFGFVFNDFLPKCTKNYNDFYEESNEDRIVIISKIVRAIKTSMLLSQDYLEAHEKILKDDVSDEFLEGVLDILKRSVHDLKKRLNS